MKNLPEILLSVALAASVAACSSTDVVAPTMNVSIGQQLIDLKKAREAGAISEREWEQQKGKIIDSVN